MTLDEKVGQMTQPDQSFLKSDADVAKYYLGSVLSGGDSGPKEGNSLEAWTNLIDRYQKRALETRLSIPLLYGVDAVHGHNNVLGAVVFPHNIGLGCARNPALLRRSRASRQSKCGPPGSTGASRRASPCRATFAGAARTKATPKSRMA